MAGAAFEPHGNPNSLLPESGTNGSSYQYITPVCVLPHEIFHEIFLFHRELKRICSTKKRRLIGFLIIIIFIIVATDVTILFVSVLKNNNNQREYDKNPQHPYSFYSKKIRVLNNSFSERCCHLTLFYGAMVMQPHITLLAPLINFI